MRLRQRLTLLAVSVSLATPVAHAEPNELFGTGKPPVFKEELLDRRFNRSAMGKLLDTGSTLLAQGKLELGCVQVMGALFTALAEVAPTLHKRDETFVLDPTLQDALSTQASTPIFPALGYLAMMVRKVHLEKRLPDAWYETAVALNAKVKIIDLAKLKLLTDGVSYVDSTAFTIPVLKDRYLREVKAANSAVQTDVAGAFRDTYLDRDVAWGGAVLIDIGPNAPPPAKGKKRPKLTSTQKAELIAVLEWQPPDPRNTQLDLMAKHVEKPAPVRILAKLAPRQFIDLEKVARGSRVLVRGRFWEMTQDLAEVEVRDALLFFDRDFSAGVLLASPQEVVNCPAAINELTGVNPQQTGGFQHQAPGKN